MELERDHGGRRVSREVERRGMGYIEQEIRSEADWREEGN